MEILLIFLGLGALGLYNKAILVTFITIIILKIRAKKKINLKQINLLNFFVLLLFSLSYTIIAYIHERTSLTLAVIPCIAYFIGSIICDEKKGKEKITNYILAIALGLALHAIFNYIYALILNSSGRNTLDIWTRQITSATVQGTLLVMIESLLYYIIVCEKNLKNKIFFLIILIGAIIYNIRIGTRTPLIICGIVFVFCTIFHLFIIPEKKIILKRVGIIFLILLIIVFFLLLTYIFNIFGFKEKIDDIELVKRFINLDETNESDSLRWKAFKAALQQTFDYPFGGNKMKIEKVKYAHNFWLDINRVSGIIPYAFIILYTILILKNLIITIKSRNNTIKYKILVFSIYLGVLISYAVEPIMESNNYYFIMFCIINGIVDKNIILMKIGEKEINESTLDS